MADVDSDKAAALERKRKRLEAWKKRQEQQAKAAESAKPNKAKVTLSLGTGIGLNKNNAKSKARKKKKKRKPGFGGFGGGDDDDDDDGDDATKKTNKRPLGLVALDMDMDMDMNEFENESTIKRNGNGNGVGTGETKVSTGDTFSPPAKKKRRWDTASPSASMNNSATTTTTTTTTTAATATEDDLDKFMNELNAGAMGKIVVQRAQSNQQSLSIDVGGSMMQMQQSQLKAKSHSPHSAVNTPLSGSVITPEELAKLMKGGKNDKKNSASRKEEGALYGPSDWETSASEAESEPETDDEQEEKERQKFLQALKKTTVNTPATTVNNDEELMSINKPPQLAAEVQSEKQRRANHLENLKKQAEDAQRASLKASQPDIGRIYYGDVESGVMEEAERTLNVVNAKSVDALEVLAELNKKKELKAVDHSKVEYIPIRKNLYIVPRSVAKLSDDAVMERRAKWKIRVRGRGAPAPVETFEECGLSERLLSVLRKMKIEKPYAVQAQCLPCIMAGRDVIGIAKTGSGKTLAYLLPMLRHISDQPPLAPHESGPIGLILAPARELAVQIHHVTKSFAKQLGLNLEHFCKLLLFLNNFISNAHTLFSFFSYVIYRSTAVYGGAGVAEQIADLKRGTHIVVATPGRMIDILTMQSGKILSLQRVSYICLDEADRCYDMGFAPQISAILSAVRPDRQTVLFSATFPKTIEALARKSLKYPIEVLVGGRSVASDSIEQHAEQIEEEDKFLRLLQLLGDVDEGKKVIVFVDTQSRADSIFEQLIRCGYPSLSLHGGKEQEDRDSTISDFKKIEGPNVLVATSVAGRGLDVPSCGYVINYSAPNHLEDYVHRVGRTGRAGNKGVSYTFCNSGDESKFAPIIVRALIESGHSANITPELRALSDEFKQKVERGEARYAGSGFHGKGYTYDSSELSEAQKLARVEKRQALIEAGMLDPDEEDSTTPKEEGEESALTHTEGGDTAANPTSTESSTTTSTTGRAIANISADLLALPGMKEAIMKKAGYEIPDPNATAGSGEHFMEDVEINDYPREARWKVTQKETTSRLQDEFQIAVTLKGQYYDSKTQPPEGERKLYLHVEARTDRILKTGIQEIRRLLNEETLRVGKRGLGGHKYNVL